MKTNKGSQQPVQANRKPHRNQAQLHAAPPSPSGVQAKSELVLAKVIPSKISKQSLS